MISQGPAKKKRTDEDDDIIVIKDWKKTEAELEKEYMERLYKYAYFYVRLRKHHFFGLPDTAPEIMEDICTDDPMISVEESEKMVATLRRKSMRYVCMKFRRTRGEIITGLCTHALYNRGLMRELLTVFMEQFVERKSQRKCQAFFHSPAASVVQPVYLMKYTQTNAWQITLMCTYFWLGGKITTRCDAKPTIVEILIEDDDVIEESVVEEEKENQEPDSTIPEGSKSIMTEYSVQDKENQNPDSIVPEESVQEEEFQEPDSTVPEESRTRASIRAHSKYSTCFPECLKGNNESPYSERFHKCSPLQIPMKMGWKRFLKKEKIVYKAPCSKTFRRMDQIQVFLNQTNSLLTIDCFSFDREVRPSVYFQVAPKFFKMADLANGLEGIPIPVVNEVDDEDVPQFEYTTKRFSLDGTVDLEKSKKNCPGCSCEDACSVEKCECLQAAARVFKALPLVLRINQFEKIIPAYQHRSLMSKVITGVVECNENCKCKRDICNNRVVQMPLKYPLQLFKTPKSGWGVRALTDIPKGAYVGSYVGAVITQKQSMSIDTKFCANLDMDQTVQYSIREVKNGRKRSLKPLEEPYVVDAKNKGNLGRFYNHSCEPNVQVQHVLWDTHDTRLPHAAYFTTKLVRAGDELCWDYMYEIEDDTADDEKIFCHCGSANCRGRLQ